MKYLVAMIRVETLNLIRVKLFKILELNISDMDNYMAEKDNMDRLYERCTIIYY